MFAKGLLTVSALAAVATSATYAYTVHKKIRCIDPRRITRQDSVPESLRNSKTIKEIVDPRQYSTVFDMRYISITIPPHRWNVSDEELLSRFVKAFFGGNVIRPERLVLQSLKWNLVTFSAKAIKSKNVPPVSSVEQISDSSLLPISTKIFGAFQVLDSQVIQDDSSQEVENYIDIGFGNDQSSFAGVHRFSVSRPKDESSEPPSHVTIQYSCQVASGPKPNAVAFTLHHINFLHNFYADLLFRESVGEIEKWLQSHD